jgi:amino acid adenylation domain-containing protein
LIEWILAVLKSGAAFVYLDPDLSEVQKSAIVANCKPTLIVEEAMVEELTRSYLISSPQFDATDDVEQAKYGTADGDLAYIIYTSGSTGEPKGVMVEHGNIAAFVKSAVDVFECGFGTRVLQLASFSFDASILEWSSALCTGATLCFAQYPKRLVGEYLAEVLEKNEISFLQITPTALETLSLRRDLPQLRQISIGGEAPSREIFARWHPRVNLVNAYGPTEAAVGVSFNKIDKTDNLPDVISAGTPTRQTSIFICSEDSGSILQPQSRGEICVAGPQIARGYCGKPDITARSFVVHSSGVRMYRTGDCGALLEDGSLLILGRIDRELKVRGFRIAPEEIEKCVLDAGVGVWEVSVQPSENGLDMVAFVAPETVSSRDLQIALKRSLPSYKVPSRFHLTPSLPKSVSGKIDHKAIRFMAKNVTNSNDSDGSHFQRNDVVGDGDLATPEPLVADNDEHGVAQIWQEVLKLSSPPPPNVNFFDIGGHSLLIPMLYDRLKSAFPFKAVRLVDLFHQSTIKQQTILFGAEKPKRATTRMRRNSKCCSGKPNMSSSLSTLRSFKSGETTSATSVVPETLDKSSEIAITGIAGRFPGAKNVDEFFENLLMGRSGISESSIVKKTLPGNIWVPRAGVLQDVEDFDYEFWHLSREEATEMDPQQRLFLEVTYEALTDAGISIHNMNSGRVGLFVGAANPSYHLYTESIVTDPFLRENRGLIAPSISARTAYHLNISGPNITIQTNCASSTVAFSQAYDAIRLGRCDIAIVGGVSVQLFE